MKPAVVYPDAEAPTVDLLESLLQGEGCTVGIGKPDDWTTDSAMHVQVAWDGTPIVRHPIVAYATIRITVWGLNPGPVKTLALLAQGLLLAEPMVKPLTGVLPARDSTGAELASFTVQVATRSQPIPIGS